jgi:hypothetical protein
MGIITGLEKIGRPRTRAALCPQSSDIRKSRNFEKDACELRKPIELATGHRSARGAD